MPSRSTRLRAIGGLIGQAAAHGVLYGELHRERVLYEDEARLVLDEFGRINELEWGEVRQAAISRGSRQIREAAAKGKVPVEKAESALDALPHEVETIIRHLMGE